MKKKYYMLGLGIAVAVALGNVGAPAAIGNNRKMIINIKAAEISEQADNAPQELDRFALADHIYSVEGSMVKPDKVTVSMGNEAVVHTIKLTVQEGVYYLTLNFRGLSIGSQLGYLSRLQYFQSGYTMDTYGFPKGEVAEVTINSYQEDSSGNRIRDNYGTDYPDLVTFPLIPEALEDGYVPLQVFIPVMEAISEGSGTQQMFLKLDWTTLKATTADDSAFFEENTDDTTAGSWDNGEKNSLLNPTSTLPNTLPAATASSSTTKKNSSSSSTKKSSSSGSLKRDPAGSGVTSEKQSNSSGSLDSLDSSLVSGESSGEEDAGAELTEGDVRENTAGIGNRDVIAAGTETIARNVAGTERGAKKNSLPLAMSIVSVLAGLLYKGKSRFVFRRRG